MVALLAGVEAMGVALMAEALKVGVAGWRTVDRKSAVREVTAGW